MSENVPFGEASRLGERRSDVKMRAMEFFGGLLLLFGFSFQFEASHVGFFVARLAFAVVRQ